MPIEVPITLAGNLLATQQWDLAASWAEIDVLEKSVEGPLAVVDLLKSIRAALGFKFQTIAIRIGPRECILIRSLGPV